MPPSLTTNSSSTVFSSSTDSRYPRVVVAAGLASRIFRSAASPATSCPVPAGSPRDSAARASACARRARSVPHRAARQHPPRPAGRQPRSGASRVQRVLPELEQCAIRACLNHRGRRAIDIAQHGVDVQRFCSSVGETRGSHPCPGLTTERRLARAIAGRCEASSAAAPGNWLVWRTRATTESSMNRPNRIMPRGSPRPPVHNDVMRGEGHQTPAESAAGAAAVSCRREPRECVADAVGARRSAPGLAGFSERRACFPADTQRQDFAIRRVEHPHDVDAHVLERLGREVGLGEAFVAIDSVCVGIIPAGIVAHATARCSRSAWKAFEPGRDCDWRRRAPVA